MDRERRAGECQIQISVPIQISDTECRCIGKQIGLQKIIAVSIGEENPSFPAASKPGLGREYQIAVPIGVQVTNLKISDG